MATFTCTGAELTYEVHGEGHPILGIHGTPSSMALWADAATVLGTLGRCVIYERRGFPHSPTAEPLESVDLIDHVEDAAALLSGLDAAPAVVIGRSTGGLIALELVRRHPESVRALVLLEPALVTAHPSAADWAARLRQRVLNATGDTPGHAAEVVIREALGDDAWESFTPELKALFVAASPVVLAELRGHGLDLSADPLSLSESELAHITHQTLVIAAEDSPHELRLIADHLANVLPNVTLVTAGGGHLINPAHPAVLDFVTETVR